MNLIKKIPLNRLLFFDIETSTQHKQMPEELYRICSKKFKEEDHFAVQNHYFEEGALFPELAKIICIVMAYYHDGEIKTKVLEGDEKEIIENFYKIASGYILAGHNVKGFDLPFIRLRAMVHGIDVPETIDDRGLKPWDVGLEPNAKVKILDTQDLLKGLYSYYMSLDVLCYMLGIPSPKETIEGKDINWYYWKGDLPRIIEYCTRDVHSVIQIVMKLRGEEIVNKPLLLEIFESKCITLEQINKIKPFYMSLSDEDKAKVQEIILASVIDKGDPNFGIGKDKDDVIQYKKDLVSELDK